MTCDPNTLSQNSSCLRCLTDAQLMVVKTYLLCQWSNNAFHFTLDPPADAAWTWGCTGNTTAQASIVGGVCPAGADGFQLGAVASPGNPKTHIVGNNACGATPTVNFNIGDIGLAVIRWTLGGIPVSNWSNQQTAFFTLPVTSGLVIRTESSDFDGQANGNPIASWLEQITTNTWQAIATQPTVDKVLTAGGHATVKFAAGDAFLLQNSPTFPASGFAGLHVMCVYRHAADPPNDPNGVGGAFQFNQNDNAASHHPYADDNFYENFGRDARANLGNPGINTANAFVLYEVSSAATNNAYDAWLNNNHFFTAAGGYTFNQQGNVDKVGSANQGYRLARTIFVGFQTYNFTGNIAAVYVWNRVLTLTERTQMRAFIKCNWGVNVA